MTEEMGFYIILSGALKVLLVLALIVIGPACMILMVYAGEKDEKKALTRTE